MFLLLTVAIVRSATLRTHVCHKLCRTHGDYRECKFNTLADKFSDVVTL